MVWVIVGGFIPKLKVFFFISGGKKCGINAVYKDFFSYHQGAAWISAWKILTPLSSDLIPNWFIN